jgi:hypothetical protein
LPRIDYRTIAEHGKGALAMSPISETTARFAAVLKIGDSKKATLTLSVFDSSGASSGIYILKFRDRSTRANGALGSLTRNDLPAITSMGPE